MRLLGWKNDGQIDLFDFRDKTVPPFAILSHTCFDDPLEEVSFEDIIGGVAERKPGWAKIHFTATQAACDNIKYFWVDTCCINSADPSELAEAINSMYRWYQEATKCYVLLSDFPGRVGRQSLKTEFKSCRWMTRSWTLQELLAPKDVAFFSNAGEFLGDKYTLAQDISDATGIPVDAVQGDHERYAYRARFSWGINRQARKEEDRFYALMGVCNVSIFRGYGEGGEHAERRLLREIKALEEDEEAIWWKICERRENEEACYNCGSQSHFERRCLPSCGKCDQPGHKVSGCLYRVHCIKCKQPGHVYYECPERRSCH